MVMQRSHGKVRPTLPRSRDLSPLETAGDPSEGRGAAGRFERGNQLSRESGAKHVLAKAMSVEGLQADAAMVARDTRKLLLATLRRLPSKAPIVRSNAYGYARETALAAYYDAKANEAGLETERGMRLVDRASHHRQRAQSLSVTVVDLESRQPPPPPEPWPTVQCDDEQQPEAQLENPGFQNPERDDAPEQTPDPPPPEVFSGGGGEPSPALFSRKDRPAGEGLREVQTPPPVVAAGGPPPGGPRGGNPPPGGGAEAALIERRPPQTPQLRTWTAPAGVQPWDGRMCERHPTFPRGQCWHCGPGAPPPGHGEGAPKPRNAAEAAMSGPQLIALRRAEGTWP